MKKYRRLAELAKKKARNRELLSAQQSLPMEQFISGVRNDIEDFTQQLGLELIQEIMAEEVQRRCGTWGEQQVHRHGHQPGYVVFDGRKVRVARPRLRRVDPDEEVPLQSYRALQSPGKHQEQVKRLLLRRVSCRDYDGAVDDFVEGYGIRKSSVSRQWKAATAAELQKLCQRPVPKDLLAVLIDSQHLSDECITVAVGIDKQGQKHVLGLWQGATENTTVVRALLEDLVERGLPTEEKLLIVIDGAKALRKAVRQVLGDVPVQRCRVHKQRNVVEHLPEDKQAQAVWRLRSAWAQEDAREAEKQLKQTVKWLEEINPMAARSLEEGLEETLTLHRLGVNVALRTALSSTNAIESCFSRTGGLMHRVKRWRKGDMRLRWAATMLLVAEQGFRRIKGYRHLVELGKALQALEPKTMLKAA
jgi:transposase-like protein